MSNWEYKLVSSGKGGFASPALMEKFLNDLGQDNWEIISFHQPPDNPLAFHGLARRSAQKDWTLEDAARAAARVEADKLRAEFEAKFRAGTGQADAAAEEEAETFLAEEKAATPGDLRRPRDTSRDDDPDAVEEESGSSRDEWEQLTEEDELPVFFDAIRPHMRRNQRGPGMSVGLDYLAKKWRMEEADLKTALVECGFQIPADENARPVYIEYEGELYWVNINRRGEIWINLREKPEPVFRVAQGKRIEGADEPPVTGAAPVPAEERAPRPQPASGPTAATAQPAAAKTFLGKLRGMMRRNRRGHGWSGSFPFLTKALKLDEAQLLEKLAEFGVRLPTEAEPQPPPAPDGDVVFWLNKNQRGEIWINARVERERDQGGEASAEAAGEDQPVSPGEGEGSSTPAGSAPQAARAEGAPVLTNTLAAVRLLMQPKKRGDGVTAQVKDLAAQLGRTDEELLAALAGVGLTVPESPKAKPAFAAHGDEIFWLNVNARGQVWLNAKPTAATRKTRLKKGKADEASPAE
ncbi:MAG TPA: hypothetical protein VL200_09080 [Lacunisphaera sp.]|jgi:hypothetical protein|nr:hypothetical protein [Lacunisphaera sp.]